MKKGYILNLIFKEYHAVWNTVMLAPYTLTILHQKEF